MHAIDRRTFHKGLAAATLSAALPQMARAAYQGPNVILVRFGGGVRRAETIDAGTTYAPFLAHDLIPRGALVPDMQIAQLDGVETSHAEGTLNLLTGRYLAYRDAGSGILSDRLEPVEPTLFEYLRDAYDIPSHQALLVNGEDRPQEEFFTYGVHDHYGIAVRAEMLSLLRFKLYKFNEILREDRLPEDQLVVAAAELDRLAASDPRTMDNTQSPEVTAFWAQWRMRHGDDGVPQRAGRTAVDRAGAGGDGDAATPADDGELSGHLLCPLRQPQPLHPRDPDHRRRPAPDRGGDGCAAVLPQQYGGRGDARLRARCQSAAGGAVPAPF